ncbi:hypothetical protein N7540_003313 [Penicillium herquei]|nr:hypothetical protein N7540_003313 [Penicillium herquei]
MEDEKNNTPYACSLCPSRFTRSNPLAASRDDSHRSPRSSNSREPDLAVNPPAKRLRQSANYEANGLKDLDPKDTHNNLVSNSETASPELEVPPSISTDETDAPNLDFQWPFFNEILQDATLDWTLDFLSNGIPTGSPLDLMRNTEDAIQPIELGISGLNQARNDRSHHQVRDDGTEDLPEAWLDQDTRPGSFRNHRLPPEISEAAGYINMDERNTFVENAGQLHVKTQLSVNSHMAMVNIIMAPLPEGLCSENENRPHVFPPHSTITYFLQLFFVHVHPRFPVLHLPTFDPNSVPPILLLAMAISGSSYSESNKSKFALTYLERARLSIKLMQERDQTYLRSSDTLFAFLLVSLSAMWIGQKAAFERSEGDRGDLAVQCRRCQLLDCRIKHSTASQSPLRHNRSRLEDAWIEWVAYEQKKRLGLCIYLLDCQMSAFFQRQPYISKAETVNAALPCSDTFWSASTALAWKSLLGPAEIPPSTYFLTTLTTILLYQEIPNTLPFPPLDEFCKVLYAYVLHTHVFEWRQKICMINPTGLLTSPLSLGPQQIGNTLLERQTWLKSCLTNWDKFYGDGNQAETTNFRSKNSSGILLYHLAILALDLNFSDLHIVASRSGSDAAISVAEQSLHNWLQGERANKIFNINCQMLKAAHDSMAAGDTQRSGFELAICLFMGGLTSWAMSRFGNTDLTLSSNLPQEEHASGNRLDQHRDALDNFTADPLQASSLLVDQVEGARNGLRTLKCLRLAMAFANILDRLLTG